MPPKLNRLAWRFLLLFGVLLLAATLWAGYEWFYVMSPWRRADYCWWKFDHWDQAACSEYEEAFKRGKYNHESGGFLGINGDKSTVEWMIADLKPGEELGCHTGHSEDALAHLTNQAYSLDANDWLDWWEINKDKTQEEWMRDGFEQIGITLSEELTDEDIIELLTILGYGGKENQRGQQYCFNAYRWLRDNDFNWYGFEYEKILNSDDPEAVYRGLQEYKMDLEYWPQKVALSTNPGKYDPPSSLKWGWAVDAGIPIAFCFSVLLINVSRGRVKKWKALKTSEKSEASSDIEDSSNQEE